ncbi:hypothetical protein SUGI_0519460 [Cryptomeria japonica]|nr:hypothetical protein SUGI_0519460 [Cryptomeria japonica]
MIFSAPLPSARSLRVSFCGDSCYSPCDAHFIPLGDSLGVGRPSAGATPCKSSSFNFGYRWNIADIL